MRSKRILRWAAASAAAFGLLLGSSSIDPGVYVGDGREASQAEAAAALDDNLTSVRQQVAPTPGTPTPVSGPVANPLPTPKPTAGHIALDCDLATDGLQSQCAFALGTRFPLLLVVVAPPTGGYAAFQAKLRWTDGILAYLPAADAASESLWPDCSLPLRRDNQPEPSLSFGCVSSSGSSAYFGPVAQVQFRCQADGATPLSLVSTEAEPELGTGFADREGNILSPLLTSASVTCGQPAVPTPTPTSAPTPPPDVPAAPGTIVEKDIPRLGGKIESLDGRVAVDFPPAAVAEPLRVRITHKAIRNLQPIEGHPFMTGWEFEAFSPGRGMARVESFPEKITLTVNYTEEDMLGRNPDTLRLWTWNEAASQWDELPSTHIPNSRTVIAEVNHFSIDVGTADPAVISPPFLRSFQTDLHTGASEVSLPIDVPAGRRGLAPSLVLNYSSNRVNEMKDELSQGSWTGTGWDLSLGSIRTIFPDFPSSQNLRYLLELNGSGDEIVLGTDGLWRARRHEFLRIKLLNVSGTWVTDKPGADACTYTSATACYWEVTDKSGTRHYFGGHPTAPGPEAGASRYYTYWAPVTGWRRYYYRWDLRTDVDTHDNVVFYTYSQQLINDCPTSGGCAATGPCPPPTQQPCHPYVLSAYPATISYNFNGALPTVLIDFALRPDPPPAAGGYPTNVPLRGDAPHNMDASGQCGPYFVGSHTTGGSFGRKVEETRLLQRINISAAGQLRKAYKITYDESAFHRALYPLCYSAGDTQLRFLQVLDKNGTEDSPLATMEFNYSTGSFTFPEQIANSHPFLASGTNGFGGKVCYAYALKSVPTRWERWVVFERRATTGLCSGPLGPQDMATSYDYLTPMAYYKPPNATDQEAEFRGFEKVRETRDPNAFFGTYVEHEFHTTEPTGGIEEVLSGRPSVTRVYAIGGGTPVRTIDPSWSLQPLNPCIGAVCSSYFVKLDAMTTLEGFAQTPLVTNYEYDSFGNVLLERQRGRADTAADDRTIYRPHNTSTATPSGAWIMVPMLENVYAGDVLTAPPPDAQLRSGTAFYYDGSTDAIFGPAPTEGELRRVERTDGANYSPALSSNVYFSYDASTGNKTAESIATAAQAGSMPASVARTTWAYDTILKTQPVLITNPADQQTTLGLDLRLGVVTTRSEPSGNLVTFGYDDFGRVLTAKDSLTGAQFGTEYEYQWSRLAVFGLLNRTIVKHRFGPLSGDVTREIHCLDGFGRDVQVRQSYTSGSDSVVQTGYDTRGLVNYRTNPFANPSSDAERCDAVEGGASLNDKPRAVYFYNPFDEAASITMNPGLANEASSTIVRDGLTVKVIDENSHRKDSTYDGHGRLQQVTEFTGVGNPYFTYAETKYAYDTLDHLIGVIDAKSNATSIQYDQLGRKIGMTDPDMGRWTYKYDERGNLTEQMDALGQVVSMAYDSLDRLLRKCYVAAGSCSAAAAVASFTYDTYPDGFCSANPNDDTAKGQLTKMTDPLIGLTTHWCYDKRGRELKERRDFGGGEAPAVTRSYHLDDQVNQLTYPDGEIVTQSYDQVSRLPNDLNGAAHYVQNTFTNYTARFQLDALQLGTGGTTDYEYDNRGRLWHMTSSLQSLHYAYDPAGNVTQVFDQAADPDETEFLSYDELDRLTSVTGTYGATYRYDQIGNLIQVTEPGKDWRLRYDPRYQPHAAILVDNGPTPSVDSITKAFKYDANGNLTGVATGELAKDVDSDGDGCKNRQERDPLAPATACGLRDPATRWDYYDVTGDCAVAITSDVLLVGQRQGATDANGIAATNRNSDPGSPALAAPAYHSKFDRGFVIGADPWDRAPSDGFIVTTADVLGVAGQVGHTCGPAPSAFPATYTYDAENRLVSRTDAGGTTTYAYDGQGALAKKVQGALTTSYVGDVYELKGASVTKYYWFSGRRVAMRSSGVLRYLLADHLGSTTVLTNDTGGLLFSKTYYPFGRRKTGPIQFELATDKQFTGHQRETDELYFMKSRFYDPVIGRFLQPDTIVPEPGNPQSLNRYSYVYNNPMRYTDPTGHCPAWACDNTVTGAVRDVGGSLVDAGDNARDLVVDHKETLIRYGPLASCAIPTPVCTGAIYCAASGCSDEAQFVGDAAVGCWESELCRTIAVSAAVTGCTAASGGTVAAACTAGGIAVLSYEDAIDCAGGDTGGCVDVGITAGTEVAFWGAGHGLRGLRLEKGIPRFRPREIEVGTGRNWRLAPFGSSRIRIPHLHRRNFDPRTGITRDGGSMRWHLPWGFLDRGPGHPRWRWW